MFESERCSSRKSERAGIRMSRDNTIDGPHEVPVSLTMTMMMAPWRFEIQSVAVMPDASRLRDARRFTKNLRGDAKAQRCQVLREDPHKSFTERDLQRRC